MRKVVETMRKDNAHALVCFVLATSPFHYIVGDSGEVVSRLLPMTGEFGADTGFQR